MDDYIKRSDAIKTVCGDCEYYSTNDCEDCRLDRLTKIPAADVRPVVYCRDCIHRPYSTEPGKTSGFAVEAPDRECKCPCFNPDDGYYSWIPADDFFCADGERREGGTP